jgi:hypothetical protein
MEVLHEHIIKESFQFWETKKKQKKGERGATQQMAGNLLSRSKFYAAMRKH